MFMAYYKDMHKCTYYSAMSLYSVKSCPCPLDPSLGTLFCLCLISEAMASCVSGLGIGGSWRRPSFEPRVGVGSGSFTGLLSSDLDSEEEDVYKKKMITYLKSVNRCLLIYKVQKPRNT